MKKTIALAALLSTTSASALIGPGGNVPGRENREEPVKYCLSVYKNQDGTLESGTCDQTARNEMNDANILSNGCAKGQISLELVGVKIKSCPTYTQL